MTTRRIRRKNLRSATKIFCRAVEEVIGKKIDRKRLLIFVREARSFFSGRKPRYAFLELARGKYLVFCSGSLDTLRLLVDMDFSSARGQFGEVQELWRKEAPPHIQSSFCITWSAMSKDIFLASGG